MTRLRPAFLVVGLVALLTACAGPAAPGGGNQGQSPSTSPPKTLIIGVTSTVHAFALAGTTTTAGGWLSTSELHSEGLITADAQTRTPVGRLAERRPSFDDGSIQLQADGKMRVVYSLRSGITWQDGAPFT